MGKYTSYGSPKIKKSEKNISMNQIIEKVNLNVISSVLLFRYVTFFYNILECTSNNVKMQDFYEKGEQNTYILWSKIINKLYISLSY